METYTLKNLYLRCWWRFLLSRLFPILSAKKVVVNQQFERTADFDTSQNYVAEVPEYGVRVVINIVSGTASSHSESSRVLGYDLSYIVTTASKGKRN